MIRLSRNFAYVISAELTSIASNEHSQLTHCGLVMAYGDIDLSTLAGNGLLPDGTKQKPEPILAVHQ